jgi:hypothetical protein
MPKRLRRLLLVALLLGLAAGCAHRPDPAAQLVPSSAVALPEADYVLTLLPPRSDFTGPPAAPASTPPLERVFRGQAVFIRPQVAAPSPGLRALAGLRLELEIRKPGFLRPVERATVPAEVGFRFRTTEHDPLGDYTLTLRLVNPASGETRVFEKSFRVEDYRPPVLASGFEPQTWLTRYYLQPTPDLALPALRELHLDLPADKRAGALPPLLGFYDQLLRDNPWLLPAFSARLAGAAPDEAYLLSLVLGFHLRDPSAPKPAELDDATWTRLADFRTYDWPSDPETPLSDITQLDALWGRFFAAGRYADLRTLLLPLAHHADLGAAERWHKETRAAPAADLGDTLADAPPEVKRDLLLRSALWSLRSNARQHPLVRDYLEWTLASGELPPAAGDLLNRVLQSNPAD